MAKKKGKVTPPLLVFTPSSSGTQHATVKHYAASESGVVLMSNPSTMTLMDGLAQDVCSTSQECPPIEPPRPKRHSASDDTMNEWLKHRGTFLDNLLAHESRMDASSTCSSCGVADSVDSYHCADCFNFTLICRTCCQSRHQHLPFHRIKRWNGTFFERAFLRDMGITLVLHHSSKSCIFPTKQALTILNINGFHYFDAQYCSCPGAPSFYEQLLSKALYPATLLHPQTCATFQLLNHLHLSLLESKGSILKYYTVLEQETDNTDQIKIPNCYRELLRIIRQWRHLKLLKRGGRGQHSLGVASTGMGDLAVVCPACPQPGLNLPTGWNTCPNNEKYLYQLILAVDANFRLKNKDQENSNDQSLGDGWAYFVNNNEYHTFLSERVDAPESSTCSGLMAIDLANKRNSKGLRATGVGAAVCARHGVLRANGIGDLQKGEKYANMDYVVFSSLRGTTFKDVLISYDISCQWSKNLVERHTYLPHNLQLDFRRTKLDYVIPKFHLPSHKTSCHTAFSLNLRPGVGRTDGEEIERRWAFANEAAASTREMGEGSRHDTLDDVWGASNYHNALGLRKLLEDRYTAAMEQYSIQTDQFESLSRDLSTDDMAQGVNPVIQDLKMPWIFP